MNKTTPFFIAGCVRSGTTMLREVLRRHPMLECPEETHFFRWSDPFASNRYDMVYTQNKLIAQQHEMDGISQEEFDSLYQESQNRKELTDRYMALYLEKLGNPNARWFDKTPQHIYGLFLIKKFYPEAKFLHIYRNPLNVAASLLKGQVMPKHSLIGAVNYWNESMILMEAFERAHPESVLNVCYEDFCNNPAQKIKGIAEFIGEDISGVDFQIGGIHPEKNKYKQMMDEEQVAYVRESCSEHMKKYGYIS